MFSIYKRSLEKIPLQYYQLLRICSKSRKQRVHLFFLQFYRLLRTAFLPGCLFWKKHYWRLLDKNLTLHIKSTSVFGFPPIPLLGSVISEITSTHGILCKDYLAWVTKTGFIKNINKIVSFLKRLLVNIVRNKHKTMILKWLFIMEIV